MQLMHHLAIDTNVLGERDGIKTATHKLAISFHALIRVIHPQDYAANDCKQHNAKQNVFYSLT